MVKYLFIFLLSISVIYSCAFFNNNKITEKDIYYQYYRIGFIEGNKNLLENNQQLTIEKLDSIIKQKFKEVEK
jgi:hypothetical protein